MTFQRKERKDERTEFVMPGTANKLDAPLRPGFVRRWAVDKPGQIAEYQSYGYSFAVDNFAANKDVSEASAIDTRISRPAGGGFTYYLMEVSIKRHNEIQAYKKARNDEITKSIGIPTNPHIYAPKIDGREQLGLVQECE